MRVAFKFPAGCLLVACCLLYGATGYSTGAPNSACSSMTPSHGGTAKQTTPSPYQITPGGTSVAGGSDITVTLSTVANGDSFMGFLVQAKDADTGSPLGKFTSGDTYKSVTCNNGKDNTLTHSSSAAKQDAQLQWTAPADFGGDITFVATVVKGFTTFWTNITSEKVTVKRSASAAPSSPAEEPAASASDQTATSAPVEATTKKKRGGLLNSIRNRNTRPTTARTTTTTDTVLTGALDSVYLGCNVNKGCFGLPSGCDGNCKALFTYTKTSEGYQFELMGTVEPGTSNAYIAGGLSYDEDMGTDNVVACYSNGLVVNVSRAWNEGRSSDFLEDDKQDLSNYEMKQIDGQLYCRYTMATTTVVNQNVFDLDNRKFYVMVAKGPLSGDGRLSYHSSNRIVSAKATSLSAFETLDGSSNLYVILHACFMVAAWVGAASSGILLARYFKQTWRNYKACNVDQWFHFHRLFMVTTWGLTIAGFVLILLHVEGWTSIPANQNPHAYVGIVSIGLCFIQPFMAMCRCAPTNSRRPVFNWIHWFVGNAAQTLGITAIFFGLELYGMPRWTWWIMIFYVGFHCLVHIILSIGECVSDSKAKNQVNGMPMKEFNSSRDMLQPPQDILMDAPGGTFRKAMLGLYLIIVWLIVALLLLVISVGEEQLKEWKLLFWED